jgi:hypothetical protein
MKQGRQRNLTAITYRDIYLQDKDNKMSSQPKIEIKTVEELLDVVKDRIEEKRVRRDKTRTKQEGYEIKGEIIGMQEVIYLIEQYDKTRRQPSASGEIPTLA